MALFVDATTLFNWVNSKVGLSNNYIKTVCNWFLKIKLTVNVKKIEVMQFGRGLPQRVSIAGKHLFCEKSINNLGLNLDIILKFQVLISFFAKKLNKFCGFI